MKIGIYLRQDFTPTIGGGYSYFDKLMNAIDNYTFSKNVEICYFTIGKKKINGLNHPVINLVYENHFSGKEKLLMHIPIVRKIKEDEFFAREKDIAQKAYKEQLKENGVQLAFYLIQTTMAVENFPFIANNWDIGHCSTYAFPELILNGNFKWREHFYKQVLPQALMIFAESETGRQELIRYTLIKDKKIKVLPIFAGDCIKEKVTEERQEEILSLHGLEDNKFFFYPAQFWAHKNHYGLLQAFAMFKKTHPEFKLVLTGSDKGNRGHIENEARELRLEDSVLFLGFVENEVINTMYKHATALVMASYFGPTNMPPLEALHLGCPVICTDLSGHREELADAAIYFDTEDYNEIYKAMEKILTEREEYKERMKIQVEKTPFRIENTMKQLNQYLCEVVKLRSTWGEYDNMH